MQMRFLQWNSHVQFPSDKTPFSITALMVCHMLLCCQLSPHLSDIQAFISMGCKERAWMRSTKTSQDGQHTCDEVLARLLLSMVV